MDDKELTGVEDEEFEAAAQTEELETGDETGEEEEEADAELVADEGETEEVPDKTEVAFAKRLAAERKKLAKEIKAELEAEYEAKTPTQQPVQQQATPPQLPDTELESLADRLGVTTETAYAMYAQQWEIKQTKEMLMRQETMLQQRQQDTAKTDAMRKVAQMRKANQSLPPFDEARINKIRTDFKKETGADLPWATAYKHLVADEVTSGKTTRAAEQKVLKNISSRDAKTVQTGAGGKATPLLPGDMNDEQWARHRADVEAGKYLSPEAKKRKMNN